MIEIGLVVVFIGFLVFVGKYLYPAVQLANELKTTYKEKGYWFPEEWE